MARGVETFDGTALRRYRLRARLTADELAGLLGVSESTVLRWETASTKPTVINVKAAADALGIDVAVLMPRPARTSGVRELRQLAGLSLVEAARQAGVSPTTLGRIERGSIKLSRESSLALCSTYGVSREELASSLEVSSRGRARRIEELRAERAVERKMHTQ